MAAKTIDKSEAERIVHTILESLPLELRQSLDRVQLVLADYPSEEQMEHMELCDRCDLFGLYEGLPLPERSATDEPIYPDRIFLFLESLRDSQPDEEDLRKAIRDTLLHEFGHHFGFEDEVLAKWGIG